MTSEDEEMPLTLPDTQKTEGLLLTQSQEVTSTQNIIWGRLFPNRSTLKQLVMSKDMYTLGRQRDCDIHLTDSELGEKWVNVVSKVHFHILRETLNRSGDTIVYLKDVSYNGTFINKELVGKGNKVILQNNDVISLAQPFFEVYTYMSISNPEGNRLPPELRGKYVVSRTLGSGVCGEVKLILGTFSCKKYALKTIKKKNFSILGTANAAMDHDKIMNEVGIMKALRHPFIVKMEEIVDTPTAVYLVLEMMEGGELFDRIKQCDGLLESVGKMIFYQIVRAVEYLHGQGITHRDLKPENILLASDAEYPLVKISDFGLSKFVDAESMMRTFCGTPMYVAPEILITSGRGTYTKQVDVWSLGVILYVSLSGRVPFSIQHATVPLQDQIMKGMYRVSSVHFDETSQNAIHLIRRMMTTDPIKRITIEQVRRHPWLQDRKMKYRVQMLINRNQENRIPPRQKQTMTSTMSKARGDCVPDELAPHTKRLRLE